MKCPNCGEPTGVIKTFRADDYILRRRQCNACGHRFTTRERPADQPPAATSEAQ